MSSKTIWTCTMCDDEATTADTRSPKWWNLLSIEIQDGEKDWGGKRTEIHLCQRCSEVAVNQELRKEFWTNIKQKFGFKRGPR